MMCQVPVPCTWISRCQVPGALCQVTCILPCKIQPREGVIFEQKIYPTFVCKWKWNSLAWSCYWDPIKSFLCTGLNAHAIVSAVFFNIWPNYYVPSAKKHTSLKKYTTPVVTDINFYESLLRSYFQKVDGKTVQWSGVIFNLVDFWNGRLNRGKWKRVISSDFQPVFCEWSIDVWVAILPLF